MGTVNSLHSDLSESYAGKTHVSWARKWEQECWEKHHKAVLDMSSVNLNPPFIQRINTY